MNICIGAICHTINIPALQSAKQNISLSRKPKIIFEIGYPGFPFWREKVSSHYLKLIETYVLINNSPILNLPYLIPKL